MPPPLPRLRRRTIPHEIDHAHNLLDESPLAETLFRSPSRAGRYTQGDATYLSLARSLPPHRPSILSLLSRMRSDRSRPSFPEYLFFPIFRAFAKSDVPFGALHLFDEMLPVYRCRPSVRSLNSALAAFSPSRPDLALPFFYRAVREHSGMLPNLLTFNLLLKALCRCGRTDEAVGMLREMPDRGVRPDAYSYSTLVDGLCRDGRLEEAMALLDEMQAQYFIPPNCYITCRC